MDQFAKETLPVSLEEEMRRSYLDYAMSVIVGRALPDVRDGLKPVHRRVLYAMQEANIVWNRPYVKCARVVGDVMGKYHPHGDTAIYDTLVRMAQDFSMRYPLIDGQGNFGSVDGDNPAAMRYTECRLARIASELLADIDSETVDFVPNYDGKEQEPTVLPTRLPNLLVNGSSGIAVGMATNIPPHNLTETIDACLALLANPDIAIEELIKLMPAPDFPTAGMIYGTAGVHEGYRTGRGRVVMRARTHFEDIDKGARQAIVVDELPYQVNKKVLLERIAELVREKKHRGHLGHPGRIGQVRHAGGDRAEARRGARGRPQQPVQADAAPGHLRHEHGRARRRPAEAAQPEADARRRSSRIAARSSPAARSSSCARRASARTCRKGSRSRSRTSTRSSR